MSSSLLFRLNLRSREEIRRTRASSWFLFLSSIRLAPSILLLLTALDIVKKVEKITLKYDWLMHKPFGSRSNNGFRLGFQLFPVCPNCEYLFLSALYTVYLQLAHRMRWNLNNFLVSFSSGSQVLLVWWRVRDGAEKSGAGQTISLSRTLIVAGFDVYELIVC